jgi:hypothetical protein
MGFCLRPSSYVYAYTRNAITHIYSFCPGAPTTRSCICAFHNTSRHRQYSTQNVLHTPIVTQPASLSPTTIHSLEQTHNCNRENTTPPTTQSQMGGVLKKHGPSTFVDTEAQVRDPNNAVPDSCQNSSSTTITTGARVRNRTKLALRHTTSTDRSSQPKFHNSLGCRPHKLPALRLDLPGPNEHIHTYKAPKQRPLPNATQHSQAYVRQ